MQAREGILVAVLGTPGGGQGLGQRGLLVEQLGAAVADPARLDQDDLRRRTQQVGQHPLLGVDEGQPRLHAVELLAPGQPVPGRGTPGPERDQALGLRPQRVGEDELATAVEERAGQVARRALVTDGELGQPVDLVTPQVDTHRRVRGGREDVDDAAAHRELAPVLHLVLAPVPLRHQFAQQRVDVDLLARPDREWCRARQGPDPLQQRPDRRHDHPRRRGQRSSSGSAVSACRRASRRPIVSVSGLTRSKGNVSQAGRTTTGPARAPARSVSVLRLEQAGRGRRPAGRRRDRSA